ncbi:MAG: hypothetical protein F4Y61_02890 [Rhodothermaceae bacterium]|nr:hypothetical protein [Rhodothermaceae bacterium]MYF79851.1 hypothetical protein [Chloroflexota bacterium]
MRYTNPSPQGSNGQAVQLELFPESRRGRPKKEIQRTGPGRNLTADELNRERKAFTCKADQKRKMIQRIRELTGNRKAPWIRFLIRMVECKFFGLGYDPRVEDYGRCFTSQSKMAQLTGKSRRQVKRYIADAKKAGLLIDAHNTVSYGNNGIHTEPKYILTLGVLNELNVPASVKAESAGTSGVSELNVPQPKNTIGIPTSAKPGRASKRKTAKKESRPAPKLTTAQRYDIANARALKRINAEARRGPNGKRIAGWFERWIRNRLKEMRELEQPIDYRGREVWILELAVRDPELFEERLQAREDRIFSGALLNRGAFLKAGKEARNQRKESRIADRKQLNQLDVMADQIFTRAT